MQRDLSFDLWRSHFLYQDSVTLRTDQSLKELLKTRTDWQWDEQFIKLYLSGQDTWPLSPVAGIRKVALAEQGKPSLPCDFVESLKFHFASEKSKVVHIALSGGVDSQVLALSAMEMGFQVQAVHLRTDIQDYCEAEAVTQFCQEWSIRCLEVKVSAAQFEEELASFTQATECPVYNLHPLSKWILAKAVSREGIKKVYTGDGADQTFAGATHCDLFFLTKACFKSWGVELVTPFASAPLFEWAQQIGPYPNKEPLRQWASQKWGIGHIPKSPRFFPDPYSPPLRFQKSLEFLRESLCAD